MILSISLGWLLIFVSPNGFGDQTSESNVTTGIIGGSPAPGTFVNPISKGADPWIVRDPNSPDPDSPRYLWCISDRDLGISIQATTSLTSTGTKHLVWEALDEGPYSREVWAPELHYLNDRWYVYFAASDGDNHTHLAYVLESKTTDPLGEYTFHGPMATGDGLDGMSPNVWAIDMTVLEHDDRLYAIWSGWDAPGTDRQYLYIAPMSSPTKLSGPRVRLCDNDDFEWERTEAGEAGRGLNEAPQVFKSGKSTSLVYSCAASWLPSYKLGLLELVGEDPLNPKSWRKRKRPVFEGNSSTFGVGHSCFVRSPDGEQWWHIYHAKIDREPGWHRAIYVQPMKVGPRGFPIFGEPVKAGTVFDMPSGQVAPDAEGAEKGENGAGR